MKNELEKAARHLATAIQITDDEDIFSSEMQKRAFVRIMVGIATDINTLKVKLGKGVDGL